MNIPKSVKKLYPQNTDRQYSCEISGGSILTGLCEKKTKYMISQLSCIYSYLSVNVLCSHKCSTMAVGMKNILR